MITVCICLHRSQSIKDLVVKNKIASTKWQQMDPAEKAKYEQLAAQLPSVSAESFDKWHETQRILKNMQENVCVCNVCTFTCVCTACK